MSPLVTQIVNSVIASQVEAVKARATGMTLSLAALGILLLATGFAMLALYLGLATVIEPWQAALAVAGALVVLSLIVFAIGRSKARSRKVPADELGAQLQALMKTAAEAGDNANAGLVTVAAALMAGLVIGRNIGR